MTAGVVVPVGERRVVWDGIWYPSVGRVFGLPAFRFRAAPSGLATRRQLRAAGLCPGGQEPVAVLTWRRSRRWAWLYRVDVAQPKRVPSPAQVAALGRAMTARRRCDACGTDAGFVLPTSDRRCGPCYLAAEASESGQVAA
jgi:hypothetical protein